MEPATIIAAAITATAAAATTATTAATSQFQNETDAYIAEIVNLSSYSFKIAGSTSEPVRGQWMKAPSNLTSIYDLVDEHPNATKEEIDNIVKALGNTGQGLSPFSICTMAKAGGLWGPAGLIHYDVIDRNGHPTGDRLIFMMLVRPNWDYTAGVLMGSSEVIDKANLSEWNLYKAIEDNPNSPLHFNPSPGSKLSDLPVSQRNILLRKYFSDGPSVEFCQAVNAKKVMETNTFGNSLKINFQPSKTLSFTITDSYKVNP